MRRKCYRNQTDFTSPIFTTLHREYEAILERGRSIDSRAGIFLTFLFTAFPFYLEIVGIEDIKKLLHKSCFSFAEVLLIITFLLSTAAFLTAFVLFVIVLSTRKYKGYNNLLFRDFDLKEYEKINTTVNDVNVTMTAMLHEFIDHNNHVIEKKARKFDAALWICFSYVALMVLTLFLKML